MMPLSLLDPPPLLSQVLLPLVVFLVLMAVVIGGSCSYGYTRGAASIQADWDAATVAHNKALSDLKAKHLAQERKWAYANQIANDQLAAATQAGQAELDAALAAIADGDANNRRLRQQFRACNDRMPADPGAVGDMDEASQAGLSRQSESDFIRIGAECDQIARELTGCQSYVARLQPARAAF